MYRSMKQVVYAKDEYQRMNRQEPAAAGAKAATEEVGDSADSNNSAEAEAATEEFVAVVVADDSPAPEEVVAAVEAPKEEPPKEEAAAAPAVAEETSASPATPPEPILPDIPEYAQYLLVGAGSATFAAFRAIKARDPKAKILIVGEENEIPYMRPPLSKDLWFNDDKEEVESMTFKQYNGKKRSIYYEKKEFYTDAKILNTLENGGVALLSGKKVVKIDASNKKAFLHSGEVISYDKCLLATGGKPKNLDILRNADEDVKKRTLLFRNAQDFKSLEALAQPGKSVAIVGGGFLGSELACALGKRSIDTGMTVYQIMPENGNMGKVLPEYLSKWTTKKIEKEGVKVMTNKRVSAATFDAETEKVVLETQEGDKLSVDTIVAAVGLEANTDMARPSGLEVDPVNGGFLVNAELMARQDLYVAGDCACFYDVKLGRRRVEHHDHAVVSGRLAGENMAGSAKPYWHQSMFWSDLGPDVGYEAIGICDASLPTTAVFAKKTSQDSPKAVVESTGDAIRSETESEMVEKYQQNFDKQTGKLLPGSERILVAAPAAPASPVAETSEDYGKGIVFYTKEKTVVGILLWNCFNRMSLARQVLKDGAKGEDLYEVAKMFDIYDSHLDDLEAEVEKKEAEVKAEEPLPIKVPEAATAAA